MLDIYRDIGSDIVIFQYESNISQGYHNNIHDRSVFKELYSALEDSSNCTLFVDTDELLYFFP